MFLVKQRQDKTRQNTVALSNEPWYRRQSRLKPQRPKGYGMYSYIVLIQRSIGRTCERFLSHKNIMVFDSRAGMAFVHLCFIFLTRYVVSCTLFLNRLQAYEYEDDVYVYGRFGVPVPWCWKSPLFLPWVV